jgi:pilus assembly protein Flp/PilA
MIRFLLKLRRWVVSEDGPTTVEYAVMLSLILLVCFAAIHVLGTQMSNVLTTVADWLE